MKRIIATAFVLLVLTTCAKQPETPAPVGQDRPMATAAAKTSMEEISSPAGDGAAEPFVFASGDGVVMSWLEPVAGTDRVALRFARYDGTRWSAPKTIVERNDLFVNWADFPSIVEDANGALFVHWLQKSGPDTYAYDVRMSASRDGGATWSAPFLLNRDGTKTEHGFVSVVPLASGGVAATWLDGRKMTPGAHENAGDMTLRYAAVTASGDLAADEEIDPRVCECCTTGMAMTASGPVVVYRDRNSDEIRDIGVARRTENRWSEPRPLHADGWKINGCPVNGPQIDASGNAVVTAWFTAAGEKPRVLAAFSADGGGAFSDPVVIDDGKPVGRVDVVLLDEHTALVSWLEQTAGGAELRARRVSSGGQLGPTVKIADSSTARGAGFARIARTSQAVWFAWTEQGAGAKRVRVARMAA